MNHWQLPRLAARHSLTLLFVLVLAASCAPPPASSPVRTNGSASTFTSAYNFDASQNISGIFVKLYGFICSEGPYLENLTLVPGRRTVDAGSSETIQNYLDLLANNADLSPDPSYVERVAWMPYQVPSTLPLQWMPGSTRCYGHFTLTNLTSTAIEIQRVGLLLTETPTRNIYHYQRVSIIAHCHGCHGGGPPCAYNASVKLDEGTAGSTFDAPVTSTDPTKCPLPLPILAGDSAELTVLFQDRASHDLIYRGRPVFTIKTAAGEQPLPLTAITASLMFIHSDDMPCYQFEGETFVSGPCPPPDHEKAGP